MENNQNYFRTGTKVALRLVLEEDIPQFHSFMNDPEVTQFLSTYLPVSIGEERDWYEKVKKPTPNSLTLAMVDKENGILIGAIDLRNIDRHNMTASTGTSIGNKEYWGKGYGTEAKMLLLDLAFNEMNLRKIYSDVAGYNGRSLAYAKKCGYKEEARVPNHYYKKGQYWDKIILAVYRENWEEAHASFLESIPK